MKKSYLILPYILIGLLFGCSGNKVIKMMNNTKPKGLKSSNKIFAPRYNENLDKITDLHKSIESVCNKEENDYDFENELMSWKISKNNTQKDENYINVIAPTISPDGEYEVFIVRDFIKTGTKEEYHYSINLINLITRNMKKIFDSNDNQFTNNTSKHFNNIAWAPFSKMFCFVANYEKRNNIFLVDFRYDSSIHEIEYNIFKVTDNNDINVSLYDLDWSYDGKYLSYTKGNNYGETSVHIFDFTNYKTLDFAENLEASCFRFGKSNLKSAFFVTKESDFFFPNYVKDFKNSNIKNKKVKIVEDGSPSPYFQGSFSFLDNTLTFVNYISRIESRNEKGYYGIYNFKEKEEKIFHFKESLALSNEFTPFSAPVWLFDDNFIVFVYNSTILYSYVNKNYLKENELTIKKLFQNNKFSHSLTSAFSRKKNQFVFSFLETSGTLGYTMFNFDLKLSIELTITKGKEDNFKNGEEVVLEWPENIRNRKAKIVFKVKTISSSKDIKH